MPHASVYVLASLISGVSTALILASGPSYTELRPLQRTVEDAKGSSRHDGCRDGSCQVAYLNSVEDFCLWAPSQSATEHTLVAWCTDDARGTHPIPDGTITGAHLLIAPDYVQITGIGQLSNINVPADGVATASGQGHRLHGNVFTSAYGPPEKIHDWTSFVSQDRFCFRACKPSATASGACPQIHDIFGCLENVPGDYDAGVFKDCIGGTTEIPSALHQEVLAPLHDFAHPFSRCTTRGAIGDAQVARARRAVAPLLITSLSHPYFRPYQNSLQTTTDTATIVTFPPLQTSTPASIAIMNSSTPVSSDGPTYTPHSYNHTHTRSRSHRHSHSRMHPHHHSPSSSSTAFLLNDSSSTSFAPSSPDPLTPYFTFTFTSDPPFFTSSVTSVSVPASILSPAPTPSSPSPYETSSSSPGPSSSPPSSYDPPTPPSTSPSTSLSTSPTTSSSSSYAQTSDPTSLSLSSAPTLPTSPSPSTSSFTSPSPPTSSSTSSQSSYVVTFTTPSSSVPSMPPVSSFHTIPNSQTQIGSQCPPYPRAINAGFVVPLTPFLPLTLPILMIVFSSSIV